jgi:hypothetical protein
VQQAQSGGFVPIQLDPCLHPCLQVTGFNHRHYFECRGSQCEAAALMWVTASATDCPPDAFSGFDRSQCTYGNAVDIALDTTTETGAIEGSMLLEIPFFTNSDAEAMANAGGDIGTIKEIVNEYPRQEDRIVGGTPIQILPGNPAASQSCAMGGCSCFEIGF